MISTSSLGRFARTFFSRSRNFVTVRTLVAIWWRSVAMAGLEASPIIATIFAAFRADNLLAAQVINTHNPRARYWPKELTMQCQQCGNPNLDNARFCATCGSALGAGAPPVMTAQPMAWAPPAGGGAAGGPPPGGLVRRAGGQLT